MPQVSLFPFGEYWWFYVGFTAFVGVLLALDLGVFHRKAHEVSFKEAALWSVVWVTLALLFCLGFYHYMLHRFAVEPRFANLPNFDPTKAARTGALEFLAGYVVEYSLSVDNIFVFVLVLRYFAVPAAHQHRVLFYGILGALVFRGVFIALGSVLMQFHWVVWLFGTFLIVTGVKMAMSSDAAIEPERNPILKLLRRLLPVAKDFRGPRFVIREGGRLMATPLLVALCCLEATDIVFALDSVPAIFALTREPFIVFSSNVFAILGLRSLFFLLGDAVERFHLLRYGLAVVLVFVGLKMVWLDTWYGGKFPIGLSLGIIAGVLIASIVASMVVSRRLGEPQPRVGSREA